MNKRQKKKSTKKKANLFIESIYSSKVKNEKQQKIIFPKIVEDQSILDYMYKIQKDNRL